MFAYAETAAPTGTATAGSAPNPIVSFVPMIVVIGILYFLVIRPQQKSAKDHQKMVDDLKSGDRVLTQGGIFGTVASLKGTVVVVKIAENVKVEVNRSSITQVILEPSATNGAAAVVGERS